MKYLRLLVVLLFPSLALGLNTPSLLRDPTGLLQYHYTDVRELTVSGGLLFFTARDTLHGRELWVSDGTPGGTKIVQDIYPGQPSGLDEYYPTHSLTDVNGTLFFIANDGSSGWELWKSDGTTAGTKLVKDIYPGLMNSLPTYLCNVNGILYFGASHPTYGRELWRSDGTLAGTAMVSDIVSGTGSSSPTYITNVNGISFFEATSGAGSELWKSDGTLGGTVLVKDIYPGSSSSFPNNFAAVGSTAFFKASSPGTGDELWKSDGTSSGTVLVKDIFTGTSGSDITLLTNVNGVLFFDAKDANNNYELWKSDGTTTGTIQVKDIHPTGSSYPSYLSVLNGILYFRALEPSSGEELWRSDGSVAGTYIVKDVVPGVSSSNIGGMVPWNGAMYFLCYSGSSEGLWKSDGTTAGTIQLKDLYGGIYLTASSAGVFFTDQNQILSSDGTALGTVVVSQMLESTDNFIYSQFFDLNGLLLFATSTDTDGTELWRSDGTVAGTEMVKNIAEGSDSSWPSAFVQLGNNAYFLAYLSSLELWKTDGTEVGTSQVTDGLGSEDIGLLNQQLYFAKWDEGAGYELWKSDGTGAGTSLLKDLVPGFSDSYPNHFVRAGNRLFFFAGYYQRLWTTDGTSDGTIQLDSTNTVFDWPTPLNSLLLYSAGTNPIYLDLWRSDGTPEGTMRVVSLGYPPPTNPSYLVNFKGAVYFSACTTAEGCELWKSDGTEMGTALFKDINPGAASSNPAGLKDVGGTLYFRACDSSGCEVWKSDGTSIGTVMVKDIWPGPSGSMPSSISATTAGEPLVFAASDGFSGLELWRTDGTASGTELHQDAYPGHRSSDPENMTISCSSLFYSAANQDGESLWAISLGDYAIRVGDASVVEGDVSGNYAQFKVRICPSNIVDVMVDYTTIEGTAVDGLDYQAVSGTLTIPAGESYGIIQVPIVPDTLFETGETFSIHLSNPVNATLITQDAQGVIIDDDTRPVLSVSSFVLNEGETGHFVLSLNHAAGTDTTIYFQTEDWTASANQDYTPVSGSVSIPAGQTTANIAVGTVSDFQCEPQEEFHLLLLGAEWVRVFSNFAVGIINDPDSGTLEVPSLSWFNGSKTQMGWTGVPNAAGYRLYRGTADQLPALLTPDYDSCLMWESAETTTGDLLADTPTAGTFWWYVVVTEASCGALGPAGNASSGPRILNDSGSCF